MSTERGKENPLNQRGRKNMRDNVSFITYGADYITVNREQNGWVKVSKVPVLTMEKEPEGGKEMAIAAEKIFRLRF